MHENLRVDAEHVSVGKKCYKGVLLDDLVLDPGMVAMVKVRVKGVHKSRQVCLDECSKKLKGVVCMGSINEVLSSEDTQVELLNWNDSVCNYQKGTYAIDFADWVDKDNSVAFVGDFCSFSEADLWAKRQVFRDHLANADYKGYVGGVEDVPAEFADIVALKGDKLGLTNVLEHKVQLEDKTRPNFVPSYRIPFKIREQVEQEVNTWEEEGIVRLSSSPFNFPLLEVPKRDGSIQVCVDFRKLNEKTIPDRYTVASSSLTDVLRDDVQFVWGDGQQVAFQKIKDAFVNSPLLKFLIWNIL
ncbi:uncharacterized protein [Macrobrachium rosenbergii]|uniref:uncharacterized protein n=1 Tax=Macrobrachium rosenbergii TaxID=79674 RepID=UPI0034D619F9